MEETQVPAGLWALPDPKGELRQGILPYWVRSCKGGLRVSAGERYCCSKQEGDRLCLALSPGPKEHLNDVLMTSGRPA